MIRYQDLLMGVIEVLKRTYPTVPIYGDEVTEGYKTPCFFVNLYPVQSETETKNYLNTHMLVVLTYFSDTKEGLKNLEVLSTLKYSFGVVLAVQERHLIIQDTTSEKVEDNVYQFSFHITYKELINYDQDYELIKTIHHSIKGGNN